MFCSSFSVIVLGRIGQQNLYLKTQYSRLNNISEIDILYVCRTEKHKVKKHDRHTLNHPTHNLSIFRSLPFMVYNVRKT